MLRFAGIGCALVFLSIVSCGSSDDSSSSGGSGGAAGSTATGGGGSGGTTSTGGTAGSTTSGGTTSSGGTAGSTATGGAAGSTSSGGSAGGAGVTFLNHGTCPSSAPTAGNTCDVTAMCCYEAGGAAFVCTKSIVGVDGGAPPGTWKTVPNKTCCPGAEPTLGTGCTVPGVIGCCYGSNGYRCGGPQNPDQWVAATGC